MEKCSIAQSSARSEKRHWSTKKNKKNGGAAKRKAVEKIFKKVAQKSKNTSCQKMCTNPFIRVKAQQKLLHIIYSRANSKIKQCRESKINTVTFFGIIAFLNWPALEVKKINTIANKSITNIFWETMCTNPFIRVKAQQKLLHIIFRVNSKIELRLSLLFFIFFVNPVFELTTFGDDCKQINW